jgi:hypothetical protein
MTMRFWEQLVKEGLDGLASVQFNMCFGLYFYQNVKDVQWLRAALTQIFAEIERRERFARHLTGFEESMSIETELCNNTDQTMEAVDNLERYSVDCNRVQYGCGSITTMIVSIEIGGKEREHETPWVGAA